MNPAAVELFRMVICSVYRDRTKYEFNERAQVVNDITKENEKLTKARQLLLNGDIDSTDYKLIKAECEAFIVRFEAKLHQISEQHVMRIDVSKLVDKVIESFLKLDKLFAYAEVKKQRHIVSSLFPEKLDFDGEQHRTPRINIVVRAIWMINGLLEGVKKGKILCIEELSLEVVPTIKNSPFEHI